jgi:hypothetical protein
MESVAGKLDAVAEHQDVPKGEAAVETIATPED